MRKLILLAACAAALAVSACNTIEGAGKDMSQAGQAMAKASRDVQK